MNQHDLWGQRLRCIALWLAVLGMIGLQACAQSEATVATQANTHRLGEPVGLLIQGFNYTDDYIDSFTVNGQGGGNLFVSGPSSGGGKSTCCVTYRLGAPLPIKLKVRWVGGYCMERVKNPYPYGKPFYDNRRSLWRETEALAVDLSSGKPGALEIHIYPDGRVEAAITQGYSPPRQIFPRSETFERPGTQHKYPDCTDDQFKPSGR